MKNEIQKSESPIMMAANLVQQADGKIDVDKLEALLKVQMQYEANEAKKSYVVAMAAFKTDPPKILKDQTVSYGQTSYNHATLSNVTTLINKALSEHGMTASWIQSQDNGSVKVTCRITHILGHSEETSLTAPPDSSGKKNAIQAIGSTVTYLQRYTLLALTGLATYEQDDDGQTGAAAEKSLPGEPNDAEQKVIDAICTQLAKQSGKKVLNSIIAGMFYAQYQEYPKKMASVNQAAEWVISLERQDEWAESGDMTQLMKTIDQAYFNFETDNTEYLADGDGKLMFNKDLFIKAVTKAFGTLPVSKTAQEIADAVNPEDVSIAVEME